MSEDRKSKLELYSVGIVVEDKKVGSDQIKVWPSEELPHVNGKIADHKTTHKVSAPDAKGTTRSADLKGDAIIVAEWLPMNGSNRMTPPDVIKNETVAIYRYADTDKYYWNTMFREPGIRRLETVCYMFGDLPSGLTPFNKTSSYWCEVSTHQKKIQLHTAKSDGEPYIYDVIFDTAKGSITIKDDVGNSIVLDTPTSRIVAKNAKGSFVDIFGKDIKIHADNSITITTKTLTATTQTTTINGITTVNGKTTVNGVTTVNGATTVNGLTSLTQGLNVSGSNPSGGTCTFNGSVNMSGNLSLSGGISAGGYIRGSNIGY